VTAAVLLTFVGGADARQAAPSSFDGSCDFTGVLSFGTPLGLLPKPNTYDTVASGTCSGTLNGQTITNDPASTHFGGAGDLGCLASVSLEGGPGTITFSRNTAASSDDATLHLRFRDFVGSTVESAPWNAVGDVSGVLIGQWSFPATRELADSCAAGTLQSVPTHIIEHTAGPVVG
jgi:hypothetical protein